MHTLPNIFNGLRVSPDVTEELALAGSGIFLISLATLRGGLVLLNKELAPGFRVAGY